MLITTGAPQEHSKGDRMPYLNQNRKSSGGLVFVKVHEAAKSQVKQTVKMPPPVKIPAPSQAKG